MTDRATAWSLTINNPVAADEEQIAAARQKGWKVEGQLEKGESGTTHYQLLLRTPQVRFAAVKKQFPRAHIEIARNVVALASYVTKEETRVGSLRTSQEQYPSLSKLWDLIYDELSTEWSGPAEDEIDRRRIITDKQRLAIFDDVCLTLIHKGYHIETMAVNPQIRSCFAKFAPALLARSLADKQTDRHAVEQEVEIPTVVT